MDQITGSHPADQPSLLKKIQTKLTFRKAAVNQSSVYKSKS